MGVSGDALLNRDPRDPAGFLRKYQPDAELELAIRAYVAYLKAVGLSPEKVLIAVKQSIDEFERTPRLCETRGLTECVVSLSIEEYYRA